MPVRIELLLAWWPLASETHFWRCMIHTNAFAGLVFQFLFATLEVFKGYFGEELDEVSDRTGSKFAESALALF